tara:strand:+ start:3031 stop:3600 length:570 start_codon:yes stop_codon:yes gene_type:complete
MEYAIIGILILWVVYLYSKLNELKAELKQKPYTEPAQNQTDYKEFERKRLKEQQEYEIEKTLNPPSKKNSGNPNYDITQEELLQHMGNKIPPQFLRPKKDVEENDSIFYRKKVCITGSFSEFPVRAELAEYLWNLGADVDTQVGPTLDYLICGDGAGPSKCSKAEDQGVEVIEEDELIELLPNFKSKYL